jgi:CRP-like cAMP-binding protein
VVTPTDLAPANLPIDALRAVPWIAPLGEGALARIAALSTPVRFRAGQTILAELEPGEEMYLLLAGEARASLLAGPSSRRELGRLGPGDACGEISALTRALRSATVIAQSEVVALRLERAGVEELVLSHPRVAVHFARVLAERLADTDAALEAAIEGAPEPAQEPVAVPRRGALGLAWRELVVARRRELPFLALLAFAGALALTRASAWLLQLQGRELFGFLRGAYTSGIALVFASTAVGLLRYRLPLQRVVAVGFGTGLALILNELSVFLAFDTFYLDMTTRDPTMVFSVEQLYRRSESSWAVTLVLAALASLTFLHAFLRRALFVTLSALRPSRRNPWP